MTFLVKTPCGYVDGRQDFVFTSVYDDPADVLEQINSGAEHAGLGGRFAAVLVYRDDARHYRGEMRTGGDIVAVADCDDFDAIAKWLNAHAPSTTRER
ncbi:MAG TPA: hypothetical protein VJ840_18630 [Gemmatimonadaceae bacterium]|nr:hypothetical protein [Gemmatimonadaceae bacterium]